MHLSTSIAALALALTLSAPSVLGYYEHDIREYTDDLETRSRRGPPGSRSHARSYEEDLLDARDEIHSLLEARYGDSLADFDAREFDDNELEARLFEQLSDLYARKGGRARKGRGRGGKGRGRKGRKGRKQGGGGGGAPGGAEAAAAPEGEAAPTE